MSATTPEQLAEFLDRRIDWPRDQVPRYLARYDADPWAARPSAAELAAEFVADGEFQALRLATWSTSDQGKLIIAALELISPPFLRHDERLLVEALGLAVQLQAGGKRREAGEVALVAVVAAAVFALIWWLSD